MPELPEVETVKRGLSELIVNRQVQAVEHDWPKGFPNPVNDVETFLLGATVTGIARRGKALLIDLSTDYVLVVHLKMTGQLVFVGDDARFGAGHPNESLVGQLPDKSTRVVLTFVDGSTLYFNDQRKFGWMKLLPKETVMELPFFKSLGPEPLDPKFTSKDFIQRFSNRGRTNIKSALLDQKVIAGIGNIYADEALFAVKLHPLTLVKDVSEQKFADLFEALKEVLVTSIEAGGSSDKNYVNAEGKRGSYLTFANVFRREGKPCMRCGATIEKSRVAGRGTHTCPVCQPLPKIRKVAAKHGTIKS